MTAEERKLVRREEIEKLKPAFWGDPELETLYEKTLLILAERDAYRMLYARHECDPCDYCPKPDLVESLKEVDAEAQRILEEKGPCACAETIEEDGLRKVHRCPEHQKETF